MSKDIYNADHIAGILRKIQSEIPPILLKRAVYKVPLTPTVKMVVEKALESPTISEDKKKKLRDLTASGEFDKTTVANDYKIQKQIDNFVSRRINQEIKKGNLPPRSKVGDVDFIKDMYKKIQDDK